MNWGINVIIGLFVCLFVYVVIYIDRFLVILLNWDVFNSLFNGLFLKVWYLLVINDVIIVFVLGWDVKCISFCWMWSVMFFFVINICNILINLFFLLKKVFNILLIFCVFFVDDK